MKKNKDRCASWQLHFKKEVYKKNRMKFFKIIKSFDRISLQVILYLPQFLNVLYFMYNTRKLIGKWKTQKLGLPFINTLLLFSPES